MLECIRLQGFFQCLFNLTVQPSCHLTGLRSLFSLVLYLLFCSKTPNPLPAHSVLATSSGFSAPSLAPRRQNSRSWIITPVSPKRIIPFPKLIVWVGCDLVPRLWFPDHIMISPSLCCLTHSKIWVDKRRLFLFCTQCTEVC